MDIDITKGETVEYAGRAIVGLMNGLNVDLIIELSPIDVSTMHDLLLIDYLKSHECEPTVIPGQYLPISF